MAVTKPLVALTTESPNEENIKCVVVGDNNVGKTRLIFSRAYRQFGPNHQYLRYGGTHIPTVWANDHYRNEPQILENARDTIDGVDVSLRLWDTFGDHGKNRKFSYQRADVVVVCFSVCDAKSLEHVKSFWLPEVRHHCKRVPVVVVGCKIDLRFADVDDLNRKKLSLARAIRSEDILYPETCRQIAAEVDCPYYESSICKGFGVKEIFENVARAALVYRKSAYFYRNIHLRHVQKPLLQAPLIPPKPRPPELPDVAIDAPLDFSCLFEKSSCSDLLIVGKDFKFHAHKVILACASKAFHRIFQTRPKPVYLISLHRDGISPSSDDDGSIVPDLVPLNSNTILQCCDNDDIIAETKMEPVPDFLRSYDCSQNEPCLTTDVLTLTTDISEFSFTNIMYFVYTGRLKPKLTDPSWLKSNVEQYSDLFETGKKLGVRPFLDVLELVANETESPDYKNLSIDTAIKAFDQNRKDSLKNFALWKNPYADIVFQADDGTVPGHKAILISGSDVMSAMFGNYFVESGNKVVPFPETTVESLQIVFEYIYTKNISSFIDSSISYNDIIALANRLCLPELINVIEAHIIADFEQKFPDMPTREFHENVIFMLEVAQFHNAHNLAEWCFHHIASNYNDVCRECKIIKSLAPESLQRLRTSRWPPVWFIKDYDAYERACKERLIEENDPKAKNSKKM